MSSSSASGSPAMIRLTISPNSILLSLLTSCPFRNCVVCIDPVLVAQDGILRNELWFADANEGGPVIWMARLVFASQHPQFCRAKGRHVINAVCEMLIEILHHSCGRNIAHAP